MVNNLTTMLQCMKGRGLEFAGLHNPLAVTHGLTGVNMEYADKFTREQWTTMYPLHEEQSGKIVDVDYVVDLNTDDLTQFKDKHYKFFMMHHVLEHLVNPLRFLYRMHAIMDKGALLYMGVPLEGNQVDKLRPLTPVPHFFEDFDLNVQVLDERHHAEYAYYADGIIMRDQTEEARQHMLSGARHHSIHVHVWSEATFYDMINQAIASIVPGFKVHEQYSGAPHECGVILCR